MLPSEAPDQDGYVSFNWVCSYHIGQQSQYISRHVGGILGRQDLSYGLRFKGTATNYHALRIHEDDVERFVNRLKAHQNREGCE